MNVHWIRLVAVVTFGTWASLVVGCNQPQEIPFDQKSWLEAYDPETLYVRKEMLPDLLRTRHLKQMSRTEIRTLLGAPETFKAENPNEDWYPIDTEYDGVDPTDIWHLVVRYDFDNKRVTEIGLDHAGKRRKEEFTLL